jgi:hypothetical protein
MIISPAGIVNPALALLDAGRRDVDAHICAHPLRHPLAHVPPTPARQVQDSQRRVLSQRNSTALGHYGEGILADQGRLLAGYDRGQGPTSSSQISQAQVVDSACDDPLPPPASASDKRPPACQLTLSYFFIIFFYITLPSGAPLLVVLGAWGGGGACRPTTGWARPPPPPPFPRRSPPPPPSGRGSSCLSAPAGTRSPVGPPDYVIPKKDAL